MGPTDARGPVVSVVLATGRGGPYLTEAVAGLAGQTFTDWELVVVDDGSDQPEAVRAAVDGLPSARVVRQDNAGVAVARNVGFAASSGELVAYLDDDDVWHPDKLALQVAALRADLDAVACHTGYWFLDGEGVRFGDDVRPEPATAEQYLSGAVDIPRINTLLLRRSVIERTGGFLSTYSLFEDCEFTLRVVREGPVATLPEALVGWRRYPESVSFSHSDRLMDSSAVRAVMVAQWGAETRGDGAEAALLATNVRRARHRNAEHHASEFCHHLREGRWRQARTELGEGLHNSPATVVRTCVDVVRRQMPSGPGR
jgi:cellulose synthase/poly-beta-1,6-N-acetylglucosamine synthase-like glycosyltransferase